MNDDTRTRVDAGGIGSPDRAGGRVRIGRSGSRLGSQVAVWFYLDGAHAITSWLPEDLAEALNHQLSWSRPAKPGKTAGAAGDLDARLDRALINLAGRVQSRHCEPGGDAEAFDLAVRTRDLMAALDLAQQSAERERTNAEKLREHFDRVSREAESLRADLAQAEVDAKAARVEIQRLGDELTPPTPELARWKI